MENETDNAIFNLMQNVIDKLDGISDKIEIDQNIKSTETTIEIDKILLLQEKVIKEIENAKTDLKNSIIQKKYSNETNNHEYIMFGKDSPLNTKFLIIVLALICISLLGIKYLPPYFIAHSELKQEKENYELFYKYIYLKQFESHKKIPQDLENLFDKIKSQEVNLMNEYNQINEVYKKEIYKQELENELKKVQ